MIQLICSAMLFDLDGVLIDSTPAVARVWRWWAKEHGLDPEEVTRHAHGCPSIATVRRCLPDANHELENQRVERAEIEDIDGIVALPGARELLDAIPEDRWAIVTSGTRKLAQVRLRAAGLGIPERMVTATDIKNGKPHPEPYLKGAKLLGVPASACVVVEDVPAGIASARAAGAKVIGVRTTVGDAELRGARADYVVTSCESIQVTTTENSLELTFFEGS